MLVTLMSCSHYFDRLLAIAEDGDNDGADGGGGGCCGGGEDNRDLMTMFRVI